MLHTRTAHLPIGFRRLTFSPWQKETASLIAWARANSLLLIDLGRDADTAAQPFLDAGFNIGSADLPEWDGMISPDPARRRAAVERNIAYIRACAALNIRNFFIVLIPEKTEFPRAQNLSLALESLNALAPAFESTASHLVIEGWPGPGALCCTPETVRILFQKTPPAVGLNYDPSHLIRMHIDPLRFLNEFAARIYHIHAKDCEILSENLYACGIEQPPTFTNPRDFGGVTWRYTIPGSAAFPWSQAFEILQTRGYRGAISIELEDDQYNGTPEGEQRGILDAAKFLQTC